MVCLIGACFISGMYAFISFFMLYAGSITYTFNSFRELCAVHKIGGVSISTDIVLQCANIAAAKVSLQ